MRWLLVLALLAQQDGMRTGDRDRGFRAGGRSFAAGNHTPQFAFATAGSLGIECAGTAITGTRGEAVTFTRASSAYCTTGNEYSGLSTSSMVLLASDKPRVMTGGAATAGLMSENAATNTVLRSQQLENASWASSGSLIVTADQGVAPDGTTTMDRLQIGNPGANSEIVRYQLLACPTGSVNGTPMSAALYLRGFSDAGVLDFGINAGDGGIACTHCNYLATSASRCVFENFTVGTGTNAGAVLIGNERSTTSQCGNVAKAGVDVLAWGAQCELGPHISSYIPTTTAAATRALDVATVSYTATGATVSMSNDVFPANVLSLNGQTSVALYTDANNRLRVVTGGVTATQTARGRFRIASTDNDVNSVATFTGGALFSIGAYYDGVKRGACVGLACASTVGALTLPTGTTTIYLGSGNGAGTAIDGIVSNVCIDPSLCPGYAQ